MKLEKLSCRKRVALLCDYLDRELPASQKLLIAAHRRSCAPCSQLLASLSLTLRTLQKMRRGAKPSRASRRKLRAALTGRAA